MIRRFINRLLGRKGPRSAIRDKARRYAASELGVSRSDLSEAATRTCEGLNNAGFQAWVVGGGVRDLLLGLRPKDFDVATDATPDQVRAIFRRSRVIGRRFQIVHVMFGRETIEVSTFRAIQDEAETDEHGRVLRDNVWGSQPEDAARRAFTINALYYDPLADLILDYHDGVRDLKKRSLRIIGDAEQRFREDPVRMLRVARFVAKLGFTTEQRTRNPIRSLAPLISNVPSARLFDEMLKLLVSGHAMACLHELRREGLHHGLLPMLDVILEQPDGERFVTTALERTDQRVLAQKTISPGFLFASLLWQPVRSRWQQAMEDGEPSIPALSAAIDAVLDEQASQLAIQRRFLADMREIWMMQPRFERRTGRSPFALVEHMRLRAGYDFLILRCDAGEVPTELGDWWTEFMDGDGEARAELIARAPAPAGPGGARKRRRRRRSGRGAQNQSVAPGSTGGEP
ncbi:MAG: polynucleotide adenylyltransferase PcnB [Betaproteobacteria bacterium]